jgi:amylosucrase
LAYQIAMSTGGIPLIYLGDEVGQLNDYSYINDPAKRDDSRWVNRPRYPQDRYDDRLIEESIPGKVFKGIKQLIDLRKSSPELAGGAAVGFYTANPKVFGYQRFGEKGKILCLSNFSDHAEWVGREQFMGVPEEATDLISGHTINLHTEGIHLRAHQYLWLKFGGQEMVTNGTNGVNGH